MKACVIQPPYSTDLMLSDEYFEFKMKKLEECDESMDIIVLPEYSDVPCATKTREEIIFYHKKYIDKLLKKCADTAKRCNSFVFANALFEAETGFRNTTYAFNRNGEIVGKYFKKHIPPLELFTVKVDSEYAFDFSEPYIMEIEGLRFAFLTCYDFYFYEAFSNIARQNVDIIIGCSLQRSDSHNALEIMCRFLAYNTNAYVIRSSVSLSPDSEVCGASMIVNPKGEILKNMKSETGLLVAEFDPKDKYYKPAGYGNPPAAHYEYIEFGRNPKQYRPAGSAIARDERRMKYPRICAYGGFSQIAPKNSLPAFGAAVAMGADEIEFDLWTTKDNEWVSSHNYQLERVFDGKGCIGDFTLAELKKLDFGSKFSDKFAGLKILTFEEILEKLSCHAIMNIHIKTRAEMGEPDEIYSDETLNKILALIDKYDCRRHVYFMTKSDKLHEKLNELAPDIPRCMGENFDNSTNIVDRAIKSGCKKIQFFKPYFNKTMIDKAHENGIICNLFFVDDPDEAKAYIDMGIDTILTNNFNNVLRAIKKEN